MGVVMGQDGRRQGAIVERGPGGRPRRSAGTSRAFRLAGKLAEAALVADLEAVDANVTLRLVCMLRADYGAYPRHFSQRMIDLSPHGIVVRPFWRALRRRAFHVTEEITEARVRARDPRTDWNIRATGAYAAGGAFSNAGMEVIACRTDLGTVEFAVVRPDVPVFLHYIGQEKEAPRDR
jgi:hypothetical protein